MNPMKLDTRAKRILAVAGTILLIVTVATGPAWIRWFKVRRTFAAYSNALVRTDYNAAYGFVSPEFAASTQYDSFFRQQAALTESRGPLEAVTIRGTSVEGEGLPMAWQAKVRADLVYRKSTVRVAFEFREQDGQWKLWRYQQE